MRVATEGVQSTAGSESLTEYETETGAKFLCGRRAKQATALARVLGGQSVRGLAAEVLLLPIR